MIIQVYTVSLLIALSAAFPSVKIVGGNPAEISDFPYLVSLEQNEIFQWAHTCGGAIVSENAIVTAAHCIVTKQLPIRFRAGSSRIKEGGTLHRAKNITIHPLFDSKISDYDIAFITVIEPFEFSETVQTIELASFEPDSGEIALLAGWGVLEEGGIAPSKILQSIEILIGSRNTCEAQFGVGAFTERMICAGYPEGMRDACLFDSGDPLVVNGILVGLESGGTGCGKPGLYKRYTNVAAVKDWIQARIATSKEDSEVLKLSCAKWGRR